MLYEFLTSNRQQLIDLCRAKVAKRFEPTEAPASIDHGVPLFLEQLIHTLQKEARTHVRESEAEPTPAPTEIGRAAALHGAEMLRRGFRVDQVVHDYGDVCQCVTGLAAQQHVTISIDEFRTLNRCLDNAIADAVASFGMVRQNSIDRRSEDWQLRVNSFAAEHRRVVEIAMQSLAAIKTGNIGISGATGTLLAHALEELRTLVERSVPDILHSAPSAKAAAT